MVKTTVDSLVSIIIPCFNCAAFIEQTLKSVVAQTYPMASIEVILINDGSTDETAAILEKYSQIYTVIHTENKGVSSARNLGLTHAKGDYIQYLDSDDLLAPTAIELQVKALTDNDADVAYGNWQRFNEFQGKMVEGEKVIREIEGDRVIALFTDFWCPPAAILYSKKIVDKIGPWKQWLPIIQDARYFLDAALCNGKFAYTNNIVAQYRDNNANSLSKREKDFVDDCFKNAKDLYAEWQSSGSLNDERLKAIISCLRHCINSFRRLDNNLFNQAIDYLLKIQPNYIPTEPGSLQALSKILGYKNAERLAKIKAKIKR